MVTGCAPAHCRVAVIGAGVAGLTAAYTLAAAGVPVEVYEKAAFPGGRTRSIRQDGFVFDLGAITLLPTYEKTRALAAELGILDHLHQVSPIIGVPRCGRIHPIDLSRPIASLLATRLVSVPGKFRVLALLPALRRAWPHANFRQLSALADWDLESVASAVTRLCGTEVLNYIANPIVRGNTLNDTDHAPFGELLWMLRQYSAPSLYNFDRGINFFAETLAGRLPVSYCTAITSVEKTAGGVVLNGVRGGASFRRHFDAACVALPPPDLLRVAPLSSAQRGFLEHVMPLPSVSLHVGLSRVPDIAETFILVPAREHAHLATIVLDHLKAPGRAPAGKGAMSFFPTDTWSAANLGRSDAALRSEILDMAKPFVGDLAPYIECSAVQRWPYAIIKSNPGLYRRMAEYEAAFDPHDPCQVGGDFLSMGIEAAVIGGQQMAENVLKTLNASSKPARAA